MLLSPYRGPRSPWAMTSSWQISGKGKERNTREEVAGQAWEWLPPSAPVPELRGHGEGQELEMKAAVIAKGKGNRPSSLRVVSATKTHFLTMSHKVPGRKGGFYMSPAGPLWTATVRTRAPL